MSDVFIKITIIFVLLLIGQLSKLSKCVPADFPKNVMKFLFFLPLPLLVFLSFALIDFNSELIKFPIIAVIVSTILVFVSIGLSRILGYERKTTGSLIVAAGVTSTLLFTMPFVQTILGEKNLRYLFMYDLGNGLMAWSVIYILAGLYGNAKDLGVRKSLNSILKNPMIFALLLGLLVGALGIKFPDVFAQIKNTLSSCINPLMLIMIGMLLDFKYFMKVRNISKLSFAVIVVMGISLLISFILTWLFGINNDGQRVVLMAAASPAASLAVAFSVEKELDVDFATALVAVTMLLGVVVVPLIGII